MNVLIVLNNLRPANGVAAVIMSQYDALVEQGWQVDFMEFMDIPSCYTTRILSNGGRILPVNRKHHALVQMIRILKENSYDIVHINQTNAQTVELAAAARLLGVRCVAVHSHNTAVPGGWKRRILERASSLAYRILADRRLACTRQAGEAMFGRKPFQILKNAIDPRRFRFSPEDRRAVRAELGISDDTFVVGTVCRYAGQKNPILMIDIVNEVIRKRPDSRFLWVGSAPSADDPVYRSMRERVQELGLEPYMCWPGSREDVHRWYSAMDVFLMPSLWEGLGITYLEAQANGLPVFASDRVPRDTAITDRIRYCPLTWTPEHWARTILKYPVRTGGEAEEDREAFLRSGYDLSTARYDLARLYSSWIR